MNQTKQRTLKLVSISLILTIIGGLNMAYAQKSTVTNTPLSEQEIQGLTHMVEEEKLAGDVYQTLYTKTGLINFKNITESERRHQAALQNLLRQYGIADPTTGKGVGEFTQSTFSHLYQVLVKQGSLSSADALKVGLKIEDLDIFDLEKEMEHTQRASILQVYENLTRGSRNHLRSFNRSLRQMGLTYTPEFITQSQYDAIASSAQERGNQTKAGFNQKRGMGMNHWR